MQEFHLVQMNQAISRLSSIMKLNTSKKIMMQFRLIETKRLMISDPEHRFIITANNAAKKSGDFPNLSDEDISTIALSLQLKAELLTDDFALSNVAKNLSIKVIPVMTSGIKNVIIWKYYCPGCKTDFSKVTECPRCGNRLKRKPMKN